MLRNYLTTVLRSLRRHPGYTFINVAGLAVGMACCVLILLFVQDELRYDRHHARADRIYRVVLDARLPDGTVFNGAITPSPMAATLPAEFPEVETATRLFTFFGEATVRRDDRRFIEERFYFADSTFFDVFSHRFLSGDPATALTRPNQVVLTASTARKYFGEADPLGQTLTVNGDAAYVVTGVVEDVPAASHYHFDLLGSMVTLQWALNDVWLSNNFRTYFVLAEGYPVEQLAAKLPRFVEKYVGPQMESFANATMAQFAEGGGRWAYVLQPLTDIHLHSRYDFESEPGGDVTYVYLFSVIAVFILVIACINFMNLATGRAAARAKEVGVRKVLGSFQSQLVRRFLAESVVMSLLALVVAVGLVAAALPGFNALAGKELAFGALAGGPYLALLLGLALVVGLVAGSYPAFFLAAFRPVAVLKSGGAGRTGSRGLRSLLVVFQFTVSVALLAATAVVYRQMQYVQSKHLGFDREHVVVLERTQALGPQREAFREALLTHPSVVSASYASALPGGLIGDNPFLPEGAPGGETKSIRVMWGDHDLATTLRLAFAEGRSFSRDLPTDSAGVLLNRAAVRLLGLAEPVGARIVMRGMNGPDRPLTVLGVVEDFHFQSLHEAIDPLALMLAGWGERLAVRLAPGDVPAALALLERQWRAFAPAEPFAYTFLDDDFAQLYQADRRTGELFGVFAGLAILVACLGLFGLAAFTAEQRTKEIGVRKALGASVPDLFVLLSKDFTRLVLVAFVVATPLAYFGMRRWLADFAYRADLPWWIFAAAGLTALAIALATVSYQVLKAALTDPVKALRYE